MYGTRAARGHVSAFKPNVSCAEANVVESGNAAGESYLLVLSTAISEGLEESVMHGTLNDPQLVVLILACAAVITIGALVTAMSRFRRAEFVQLKNEMNELAGRVKVLEAAEQRHFLRQLNTRGANPVAEHATNGSGRPEAQKQYPVTPATSLRLE
jgi:hypothetical protein